MKPGEVQTYLPPPPHKIVEYLNGHIIGHYVMKKALSVAIYNHFCKINFSRSHDNDFEFGHEEALVEDAKHYFDRQNPSVSKIISDEKVDIQFDDEEGYMSPVVARVIIEAASHRVRLRGPNTLTFDSTGPSKPVNAISSTIGQLFEIPFVKCDCSQLSPMAVIKEPEVQGSPLRNSLFRRQSLGKSSKISDRKKFFERRGSLTMLMEGCNDNKETINSVITKLYRKAEFDLAKAQRGIIFLDGMDKIGNNANISELGRRQVLKEILNVLDGNSVDVTRAGSTASEYLDTSQIFFVCFGNFEERGFPHTSYGDKSENSTQKFNLSSNSPSATSDCGSNDSGNGSGEQRFNQTSRRDSQMSTDTSDGYSSEEDDSFQGLVENKLAQQMLNDPKINPIAYYQNLWGMKDVTLKFTPEALEIIANQATLQNAGHAGIATILEKLFLNIKFDILGNGDIVSVEICEDAVLGKKRPIYHKRNGRKKTPPLSTNLCAIQEDKILEGYVNKIQKVHRTRIPIPSRLTDYDMAILESIEV